MDIKFKDDIDRFIEELLPCATDGKRSEFKGDKLIAVSNCKPQYNTAVVGLYGEFRFSKKQTGNIKTAGVIIGTPEGLTKYKIPFAIFEECEKFVRIDWQSTVVNHALAWIKNNHVPQMEDVL